MDSKKDSKKEKVKRLKKLARQKIPLKNLQTQRIPSKKGKILDEISQEEIKKVKLDEPG